jgi:hypothetical protein
MTSQVGETTANLVGGSIVTSYTFTVTNPGKCLHNVMVADPHVGLSAIAFKVVVMPIPTIF